MNASRAGEPEEPPDPMGPVRTFAAGLAHDLNNMLTVVGGNLELIAELTSPEARQQAFVAQAQKVLVETSRLTDRLLSFAGRQTLAPEIVDLRSFLERWADRSGLFDGPISMTIRASRKVGRCRADPERLAEALSHLVTNAVEAMPTGGEIVMEIDDATKSSPRLESAVAVRSRHGNGDASSGEQAFVRLSITDSGTGMDDVVRAHAFEPFFSTKPRRSAGLGLSVVSGFARQSGGSVEIEVALGGGTIIRLYLPRARPQAAERARKNVPARAGRNHPQP